MEDEAQEMAALNEDEELPLTLCAGGLLDKAALRLSEVGFSYSGSKDSLLFTGADFSLDRQECSSCRLCASTARKILLAFLHRFTLPCSQT